MPALLDARACAALRRALDGGFSTKRDSVDGLADYQLDLRSLAELEALVGGEAMQRLQQLPTAFCADVRRAAAMQAGVSRPDDAPVTTSPASLRIHQVFARRYTSSGRPWFGFHRDTGPLTVNVALASDAWHEGGRLLGLYGGRVQLIERDEGEATVHPSTLLHGVNRMTGGVRYSLIVFYRPVEQVDWDCDSRRCTSLGAG